MRILMLALGSRGDVQPLIPLGRGLAAAGHRVCLATFAYFEPLARAAGLDFFPLRGDARALVALAGENGLAGAPFGILQILHAIRNSYGLLATTLPRDFAEYAAREKPGFIINQIPSHLFGGDLAEYFGVPWMIAMAIPLIRSRRRPMIGLPAWPAFVPGYNLLTYRLAEQAGWQMFRAGVNRFRVQSLGLPPLPFRGAFERIHGARTPIAGAFSPLVVPRAPDWGDHVRLTGWWYPEDPQWSPPAALEAFLDSGAPPVFVGFGSMPVNDPAHMTALIADAARRSGRRVLLHAGWGGLGGPLPPEMHLIDYAPYGWLFPRMAGVVHHGGSGTTGFALRSGVPSMVVPFLFDQHYWGARTAQLGAGPAPIPLSRLTARRLAEAMDRMTADAAMQARARDLGTRLAAEEGVAEAVRWISDLIS